MALNSSDCYYKDAIYYSFSLYYLVSSVISYYNLDNSSFTLKVASEAAFSYISNYSLSAMSYLERPLLRYFSLSFAFLHFKCIKVFAKPFNSFSALII